VKKILILLLFTAFIITANSNAFSDVPKDHWAYSAINELAEKGYMGGFPDGSFKGKETVNRYEMAVVIAKMLDKVHDVQTSGGFIDAEEAATLRKLATEFDDELSALGIRVGNLEDRVKKLEDGQKSLETDATKFKIYGSYYYAQDYTIRDDIGTGDSPGFSDPYHDVTLELVSKPSSISEFYMSMNNGMTDIGYAPEFNGQYATATVSTWEVMLSGGGTAEVSDTVKYNDGIDFDDQNKLQIDSLHYKLKAPRSDVRIFFREGYSSLDDPLGMLKNPWHTKIGSTYSKGSGIEASGNFNKDTSYFMSFLTTKNAYGNGSGDDFIALRSRYKVPSNVLPDDSLTIGALYVQDFVNYEPKVEFRSVRGMDFEFIKNGDYSFSTTVSLLENQENVGNADLEDIDSTRGMRADASYKKGALSSNMTYYNYDEGFGLYFLPDYYYAYQNTDFSGRSEWYHTWGDAYTYGERLFDISNGYTMDFGNGQNVYVKMGYTKLWWSKRDATNSWYNFPATKFNLDIYPTFSSKLKAELLNSITKDPAKDEEGKYKNELKLFSTLNDANSTKLELGVWSSKDIDYKNLAGSSRRDSGIWSSIGWNMTDTIYSKVGFDYGKNRIGWDDVNTPDGNKEYRWWMIYNENTIDLESNLTMENSFYYKKSGNFGDELTPARFIKTVLSSSFTSRLKGRFGYWWKRVDDGESNQHVHADVNYTAEDGTKLNLTYSPSWSYGDNAFDKTSIDYTNKETNKKFSFSASTSF